MSTNSSNHAIKAALISGLVFPGLGQIIIGENKRGWLILSITLVSFIVLVKEIFNLVSKILNEILMQNLEQLDMNTIFQTKKKVTSFSNNESLGNALIFILICWLVGTIDAYFSGKRKDNLASSNSDS